MRGSHSRPKGCGSRLCFASSRGRSQGHWTRPVAASVVLAIWILPTIAQNSKDPAALSLLSQAAATAGARETASLQASGLYILHDGSKVPFRVLADAGEVRWEFDAAEGLRSVVLDVNAGGGLRDGPDGQSAVLLDDEAGWGFERIPVFGLRQWIEAAQDRASLLDPVSDEGKAFDRVEVSRTDSARAAEQRRVIERATRSEVFLDRETGLPGRVRYFAHPEDWRIDIPIDLRFSDYRKEGGVQWPHLVEAYFEKTLLWQISFEVVEIETGGAK